MINKRKRLNDLSKRMGMEHELAPLLDSDEAYERFEGTIGEILEKYADRKNFTPLYTAPIFRYVGGKRGEGYYKNKIVEMHYKAVQGRMGKGTENLARIVSMFKRFYGIGQEPESAEDIADDVYGIGYHSLTAIDREVERKKMWRVAQMMADNTESRERSRKTYIRDQLNDFTKFLADKHKKDIWYGTL